MRSRISVLCLVVTVLFVSAALIGVDDASAFQNPRGKKPGGGGKPSTVDVLQFVIHDVTANPGTGRILSDGVGSSPFSYTDRRILDGGDPCVTARFVSNGGTWSHLDRGANDTEHVLFYDCADDLGITPRTYMLEFPYDPNYDPDVGGEGCACYELQLGNDGDGSCSLEVDTSDDGVPRISTSSLFKKKDKTATIDLMFRHDVDPSNQNGPESFVISSNNPLTILSFGGSEDPPVVNLQTQQGSGDEFRLNSPASEVQCDAFSFALSIDFTKFTVPQGGS